MAFLLAVDHHNPNPNHFHLESLPLIDLDLISQSDIYSLSLTSSSSSQSHFTCRFDDDVLILKIDRSVFNESTIPPPSPIPHFPKPYQAPDLLLDPQHRSSGS
ncbi:hypothetical protein C1H46_029757 [Malus baccata]|uniref:Uncharacterized protein n=1 Tax=Malus baccata TaxID=106549 RepID=A0A540LE88_MALBA|nr:hypothetical protein C1H46_029757 [Malus baccata]